MAIDSTATTRQGTVSSDIADLAYALLARERQPLTAMQDRLKLLNQRSTALGALRTRMLTLRTQVQALSRTGTLSPFAAMAATSSDASILTATASTGAADAALSVTVGQLARRATHVSDVFASADTTISSAMTGTFGFSITIGATAYNASVTVNAGDTDQTVLASAQAAISAAVGSAGTAVVVQPTSGQSRLSVASANTGTASKIAFADTDGLLARLGLVHGAPTAATDTTGGYVYEDLGGHELDARLVVDGLTYYRDSNTVTDVVSGVTLSLKAASAIAVTVKIQPDADAALAAIKDFVTKYNDVVDHLKQNTFIDSKAHTRGVLAGDTTYLLLPSQLRAAASAIVASQAAGTPNTLAVLGVTADRDGKLAIADETKLRATYTADPGAVESLFNAADGVATRLGDFVERYSSFSGVVVGSQGQLSQQIGSLNDRISGLQTRLGKRQSALEQQLARQQALLNGLSQQQAQISSFITRGF